MFKYDLMSESIETACEQLSQRIKAYALQLGRYNKRLQKNLENRYFNNNPSQFYNSLKNNDAVPSNQPPRDELRCFGSSIWKVPVQYNRKVPWLKSAIPPSREEMDTYAITDDDFVAAIKRNPNWKSPGIDPIHGYWLKNFISVHRYLFYCFNQLICLEVSPYPTLLARRTSLLIKDKTKGLIPSNYKPITCLSAIRKLLSRIVHKKL